MKKTMLLFVALCAFMIPTFAQQPSFIPNISTGITDTSATLHSDVFVPTIPTVIAPVQVYAKLISPAVSSFHTDTIPLSSGNSNVSVNVGGLPASTLCTFQICGTGTNGVEGCSGTLSFMTASSPQIPVYTAGMGVTLATPSSFNPIFGHDLGLQSTSTIIEHGLTMLLGTQTTPIMLSGSGISSAISVSSYPPNTKVYYRVRGQNASGIGVSVIDSATTLPITIVDITNVTVPTITQVGGIFNCDVLLGTSPSAIVARKILLASNQTPVYIFPNATINTDTSMSVAFATLNPYTFYLYRVVASDGNGVDSMTSQPFTTLQVPLASISAVVSGTSYDSSVCTISYNPNGSFPGSEIAAMGVQCGTFLDSLTGVFSTPSTQGFTIPNLVGNTPYTVTAWVRNSAGTVDTTIVFTTLPYPAKPIVILPQSQIVEMTNSMSGNLLITPQAGNTRAYIFYGISPFLTDSLLVCYPCSAGVYPFTVSNLQAQPYIFAGAGWAHPLNKAWTDTIPLVFCGSSPQILISNWNAFSTFMVLRLIGDGNGYLTDISLKAMYGGIAVTTLIQSVGFGGYDITLVLGNLQPGLPYEIQAKADNEQGTGVDSKIIFTLDTSYAGLEAIDDSTVIEPPYPNPASSVINIPGNPEKVSLINISGQEVRTATKVKTLDVADLPHGVYVLKVTIKDRLFFHKVLLE